MEQEYIRTIESEMLRGFIVDTPFGQFRLGDCVIKQSKDWLFSTGWKNENYVIKVEQVGDVIFDTETTFICKSQPPFVTTEGKPCGPVVYMMNVRMVVKDEETLDADDLERQLDYIRDNCYFVTDSINIQYT